MTPNLYQWVTNTTTTTGSNPSTSTTTTEKQREQEEDLKARCEWDFHLSTVVSPAATTTLQAADILGVIEFDPSDQLLATGGIARKIRFYTLSNSLRTEEKRDGTASTTVFTDNASACNHYICTPAKLSSLKWKPDSGSRVLGCGDNDGVATEWQVSVFERDEHGGRRVWSIDYSRSGGINLAASGSDDGTTQLWDPRTAAGCRVIRLGELKKPVCSVEFDPLGGPLIGLGCADKKAYVRSPIPGRPGVYIWRARQDGNVREILWRCRRRRRKDDADCRNRRVFEDVWDFADGKELRTYQGHVNNRSFVGFSVWRRNGGRLLCCGSESNEVYMYDMRWRQPIAVQRFAPRDEQELGFASSVCWKQTGDEDECTLVAGGSNGVLQVSVGRRI